MGADRPPFFALGSVIPYTWMNFDWLRGTYGKHTCFLCRPSFLYLALVSVDSASLDQDEEELP